MDASCAVTFSSLSYWLPGDLLPAAFWRFTFGCMRIENSALLQKEAATVAAIKIEKFIQDVETSMRSAAKGLDIGRQTSSDYRFELKRLLFLAPAITEAVTISVDGIQRARESRLLVSSVNRERNVSGSAAFQR